MIPDALLIAVAAGTGAALSSLLACIPGLHVYNLLGVAALMIHGTVLPPELLIPFSVAMVTGFAVLNTVPSILLAAPDESAMFTVLPGQKMFMRGLGYEGVMITTVGSAAGLLLLVAVFGPLAPILLPRIHSVVKPHTHWILWCVITFMLMSEWPKPGTSGQAGIGQFLASCKSTGMGILVFLLSGLLGFILFFRSPLPADIAFQNLMPAFVGLFTLPWLLMNLATRAQPAPQSLQGGGTPLNAESALRGIFAGTLGGGFAAFFPVVTGGIGGMLAGHATALRDDRSFLVSQGASKLIYYVGGLLLFFTPDLEIIRGGGAGLISGLTSAGNQHEYRLALAATAIGGAVALLLVPPLTRLTLALSERIGYRRISVGALVIILAMVIAITGSAGFTVMLIACGIGMLPVLYGARRMNGLGIILLPMACNMSGIGTMVASFLHLL